MYSIGMMSGVTPSWGVGTCPSGAVGGTFAAAVQFFAASQCLLQEPWPKQAAIHNGSSFDFIIVGGGTAGSTLAARLSDNPNFNVLLVEAGGDPPQESIIPGFRDAMKLSPYDWNFTTVDDHFSSQALQDGVQHQPRGKMLGGSGSINDMIYARGFPADYYEWASFLGDEWNWTTVLEYFKKTEHLTDERIINDPVLMQYHGRGGEIEVSGQKDFIHSTNVFLEAFKEKGFEIINDMTYPEKIGAGRFSHNVRDGRRDSSLTALLNKATARNNLFVLKNTLVTKILFENDCAVGIKGRKGDEDFFFFADKEVIVSAGTFNTPKLLLLSGIGPKDHLKDVGINLVKELPVGDNLHDHVMVLNYVAADNGTCPTDKATSYMDLIKYFYDRTGSLSKSDSMGAYFSSANSTTPEVPDFAVYPVCVPMNSPIYDGCMNVLGFKENICSTLSEVNKDHEVLSLAVVLLKPKSRGTVRLRSSDPADAPLIYSGTFSNEEDLAGYPEAMKIARSITESTYFKRLMAHVVELDVENCNEFDEEEALKCTARSMATSAWHAVGTAAMGSVVDSQLKVMGVKGLRVVDASVMPKVIRGNTNAPVVMIAERAVDFIKQDYKNCNDNFRSS